jgi:hypothetical protein
MGLENQGPAPKEAATWILLDKSDGSGYGFAQPKERKK